MRSFLPLRKAQSVFTHDDAWRQRAVWLRDSLLAPSAPPPHPPGPDRHKLLSGNQARASRLLTSFLHLPISLHPFCMVDIIFNSSFLGDMGDHSKSKSPSADRFILLVAYVKRKLYCGTFFVFIIG